MKEMEKEKMRDLFCSITYAMMRVESSARWKEVERNLRKLGYSKEDIKYITEA